LIQPAPHTSVTDLYVVLQFGAIIATEIFPDAIDHFLGRADNGNMEIDSDDEEDDDDDAEEIDLEKPRSKKQKRA
jgi:template-activating factor I